MATINGTSGNDKLQGTTENDELLGFEGNDTLQGRQGNDILLGFEGDDALAGGQGDDTLAGGQGDDTLAGGQGDDIIFGNEGNDTFFGRPGEDTFTGGQGNDVFNLNSSSGTNTISDFTIGEDTISVRAMQGDTISYDSQSGVLSRNDTTLGRLSPELTLQTDSFQFSSGSNNINPSELTLINIECFLTGTRILTKSGYKKVEELAIGDVVKTAEGKLEPVKWIGYQTGQPNQVKNPLRGYPILFKAGSLGNNLPERDLYTSPDHAMLVDGLLINAGALVNDVSIIKTEPSEPFCYWHVELENHSLLIAEGTAAESFYPNREDRLMYDNGTEYDELYPYGNSKLMLYPMDYARVSSKNKVPRYVRQKLMQIANELSSEILVTA